MKYGDLLDSIKHRHWNILATFAQSSSEKWQNSSLETPFPIILIIIMVEILIIMMLSAQGYILAKIYEIEGKIGF